MAFNIDEKNVSNVLAEKTILKRDIELPKMEEEENRKSYSFSLEPSAKKGLDKLAKKQGYKTTSQFLNDFIKVYISE